MNIKLLFEPRDLWIGCYWDRRCVSPDHRGVECTGRKSLFLYFCLIPTIVLRVVLGPQPKPQP